MVVGTSTEYLNVTTKGGELMKELLTQTEVQCSEAFNLFSVRGKKRLEHQLTKMKTGP